MRMSDHNLNKLESVLKVTGLLVLALGVGLGLADLGGWLRYSEREVFLQWAIHEESSLPIETLAAQAFMPSLSTT